MTYLGFEFKNLSRQLFQGDLSFTVPDTSYELFVCFLIPGDQKGLFKLAIQLRAFCCSAVCSTATGYVF
jgi:hypothetical protein